MTPDSEQNGGSILRLEVQRQPFQFAGKMLALRRAEHQDLDRLESMEA